MRSIRQGAPVRTSSFARTPDSGAVPPPYNISPSITRSTRRLSSKSEDLEPAKKKTKNTITVHEDNIRSIRTELEKIHETQSSMLKLIRVLTDKLDCVKTLVATKMSDMQTKISTVNGRVGALQTARRDGFLTSLAPSAATASLTGTPNSVNVQLQNQKSYARTVFDSYQNNIRSVLSM